MKEEIEHNKWNIIENYQKLQRCRCTCIKSLKLEEMKSSQDSKHCATPSSPSPKSICAARGEGLPLEAETE